MLSATLAQLHAPRSGSASLSSQRHAHSPLPAACLPRSRRQAGWGCGSRGRGCLSTLAAAAATSAPQASAPRKLEERPDDIVVVGAVRTANCRAKKGGFRQTPADDLVIAVLEGVMKRTGVAHEDVGDICFGSVFPSSSKRAAEIRSSSILAGFPVEVPAMTVNRQCAAGLQSIAQVAAAIRAGYYDLGIAGGVEHFTTDPLDWQGSDNPLVEGSQHAQDVKLALGLTAENVAERFGVSREKQDHVAALSHARAAAAQAVGKFKREIVPVEATRKDPDTGEVTRFWVDADDSIRGDSTEESLAKLKPYFKKGGTVTAGNCCSNTDCAAAVMLTSRAESQRRGLPVLATLRSFAAVAVEPGIMGTAPLVAVPKALERAGLSKDDIEVFELNEAFASQSAYCMDQLGLSEDRVNPNGGAIALGHPAGATGARQTVTLLHELARRQEGANGNSQGPMYGLVSMCAGSGVGAAAVWEVPRNGKAE